MPISPAPGIALEALMAPKLALIIVKRHDLGINARRPIIFLKAR